MRIRYSVLALSILAVLSSGCATIVIPNKCDPFEKFNRIIFKFNDTVDTYALNPVAKGYQKIVPKLVRESVTNFFSNINDIYIAANNLMQFRISDATSDIMRVIINTLFGFGGLFDVATQAKLPKHTTDFGVTISRYGIPSGPYLVLPLLGPSMMRDYVGLIFGYAINPLSYLHPKNLSWIAYGLNFVNIRASFLSTSKILDWIALDKYSFIRSAYLQNRQTLVNYACESDKFCDKSEVDTLPKYDLLSEDNDPVSH